MSRNGAIASNKRMPQESDGRRRCGWIDASLRWERVSLAGIGTEFWLRSDAGSFLPCENFTEIFRIVGAFVMLYFFGADFIDCV